MVRLRVEPARTGGETAGRDGEIAGRVRNDGW